MKVVEKERGQYPKVKVDYIADPLHALRSAWPCGKAAPDAVYKRDDGIVMIDPEKAAGQQGNRHPLPLPGDLLERGEAGRAEVHHVRPSAGRRLEGAPLRGGLPHRRPGLRRPGRPRQRGLQAVRVRQDRSMLAEYRLGEKVRYIGLPKEFVAGAVVFGDKDECAKGVTVTLEGDGSTVRHRTTDGFGDFEFEGLPANATYTVKIAAPGYEAKEIEVKTSKSVNLGDIVL